MQRALTRRRRAAAAHLSITPFGRATSPQGEALRVRRLRGEALGYAAVEYLSPLPFHIR